jgi:hypothetical protein
MSIKSSRFSQGILLVCLVALLAGSAARWVFPTADPPIFRCMGVTYADEIWMHEARNRAIWGVWRLPHDHWNTSLMSFPSNFLTWIGFEAFGVSTWSLRFFPRVLGMILLFCVWKMARLAWGKGAAAFALAAAALSFPLIVYSRHSIIECFLVPFLMIFLYLVFLQLRGRKLGFWIGLWGAVCLATKATAYSLLLPVGAALVVGAILEMRNAGAGPWIALKRMGIPGIFLGGIVGLFFYWLLVIRGYEGTWWYLHFDVCGKGRVSKTLTEYLHKLVLIPNTTDGVLIAANGMLCLAAFVSVPRIATVVARLVQGRHAPIDGDDRVVTVLRYSDLLALVLLFTLPLNPLFDVVGRRVFFMVPIAILLASAWNSDEMKEGLGYYVNARWWHRAIAVALVSPLLYYGVRTVYSACIQTSLQLFLARMLGWKTSWYWSRPYLSMREMELCGIFLAIVALGMVFFPRAMWRRSMFAALSVFFFASQVFFLGDYLSRRSYTVVEASRALGEITESGEPVLVNCANHLCWENEIKPIHTYKGIQYSNRDENELRTWNARYAINVSKTPVTIGYVKPLSYSPNGKRSLFDEYRRVVACYPIYDVNSYLVRWCYTYQEAPGYYVVFERIDSSERK